MSEHHHHHHVSGKNLFITIILNIIITVAQIAGGILSGSLALLSDAMHNLSDVLTLIIAYFANRLSARPNTEAKTFGYKRAEILATLFNASLLVGIGFFLIIEAIDRFLNPELVNSGWVIALGALSIVLNSLSVLLIKDDAHNNMNIKAAYLHLLSDVMTSVAVVLGGVLMHYYQIFWVDPLISVLIAFYLLWASSGLIKESLSILMQFSPSEIELDKVIDSVLQQNEIEDVHHIHIWKLDDHRIHFEAHLDFSNDLSIKESNEVISSINKRLLDDFSIYHTTFQCEYNCCENKDVIKQL